MEQEKLQFCLPEFLYLWLANGRTEDFEAYKKKKLSNMLSANYKLKRCRHTGRTL